MCVKNLRLDRGDELACRTVPGPPSLRVAPTASAVIACMQSIQADVRVRRNGCGGKTTAASGHGRWRWRHQLTVVGQKKGPEDMLPLPGKPSHAHSKQGCGSAPHEKPLDSTCAATGGFGEPGASCGLPVNAMAVATRKSLLGVSAKTTTCSPRRG